jgi:two-component system, NarL family, invasion response regulator UvrY
VRTNAVDVLLLDLSMPGMRGLDAIAKIKQASPDTQLVVLTGYPASSFEAACLKAGAQAYMRKDCDPQEVVSAIRSVAERSAR